MCASYRIDMEDKNNIPDHIKQLLIDYLSGTLSGKDRDRLEHWMKEAPEHRNLVKEISGIWQVSSILKDKPDFDANEAWTNVLQAISVKKKTPVFSIIRLKPWLRIAAMLILAFSLGIISKGYWEKDTSDVTMLVEMSTPDKSKAYITLPDSTRIWLNSGSNVRYSKNYGVSERDIQLEGEAYFVVAKNRELPFIVHTSGITVQALGTMFNVRSYPEDNKVETALEEGSVLLTAHSVDGKEVTSVTLTPNQVASYLKGENHFTVENAPSAQYTTWKESRWTIRKEPLGNFFKMLESRYHVTLTYPADKLQQHTFSGTIVNETLEEVLDMVKLTSPIDYSMDNGQVIIKMNLKQQEKFEKLIKQ